MGRRSAGRITDTPGDELFSHYWILLLFALLLYLRYRFFGRVFDFAPAPVGRTKQHSARRSLLRVNTKDRANGLSAEPHTGTPVFSPTSPTHKVPNAAGAGRENPNAAAAPAGTGKPWWQAALSWWGTTSTIDSPVNRRASMVEREAHRLAKKQRVIGEIIATEVKYADSLQTLLRVFRTPMLERATGVKPKDAIITETDVNTIFMNVHDIASFHGDFAKRLSAANKDSLGAMFIAECDPLAGGFRHYAGYVAHYDQCLSTLDRLHNSRKCRAMFEQLESAPELNGLDLMAHLIMPVQRLPRYELLLKELRSCCKDAEGDFASVCRAYDKVKEMAIFVNERKRQVENQTAIMSIEQKLVDVPDTIRLYEPHRLFIREGVLLRRKNKDKKRYVFFLFNDIFMWASTSTYSYKGCLQLQHVQLQTLPADDCSFEITDPPASVILVADNAEEAQVWYQALTTQILWARANRPSDPAHSSGPYRVAALSNADAVDGAPLALPKFNPGHRSPPIRPQRPDISLLAPLAALSPRALPAVPGVASPLQYGSPSPGFQPPLPPGPRPDSQQGMLSPRGLAAAPPSPRGPPPVAAVPVPQAPSPGTPAAALSPRAVAGTPAAAAPAALSPRPGLSPAGSASPATGVKPRPPDILSPAAIGMPATGALSPRGAAAGTSSAKPALLSPRGAVKSPASPSPNTPNANGTLTKRGSTGRLAGHVRTNSGANVVAVAAGSMSPTKSSARRALASPRS